MTCIITSQITLEDWIHQLKETLLQNWGKEWNMKKIQTIGNKNGMRKWDKSTRTIRQAIASSPNGTFLEI